ncbi:hypothetical protein KIL84_010902 [Mauremys mutica]|uniref:Uncharacterized protein n=1 Tax=Mauremys mutica TaxID=74926 RepID=A0A9D3XDU0_9SAUR|nr:hypothetical protein KIL84_010902 [Mauremys mutica]
MLARLGAAPAPSMHVVGSIGLVKEMVYLSLPHGSRTAALGQHTCPTPQPHVQPVCSVVFPFPRAGRNQQHELSPREEFRWAEPMAQTHAPRQNQVTRPHTGGSWIESA